MSNLHRKRILVSLALVLLLSPVAPGALGVGAQEERRSVSAASPQSPLEPLARLVGGQWRGQIRLLDGRVIEALNVFERGLGGKTIQFRAYGLAGGKTQLVYEGLYGWHPQQGRIVFHEHSAFGTFNHGIVEPEGDTLKFAWREDSAKGTVEYRETFRFPDTDTYVTEAYRKAENGWERFTLENRFVREKRSETAAGSPAGEAAKKEPWQRALRKEVTVSAPLANVWNAWTTSDGVKTFFGPGARIQAVIGGPYEIYFSLTAPEGQRGSEGCKVQSVVPMELFAFEWNAPPTIPALRHSGLHTLVQVRLSPEGPNRTRVELTHSNWGAGEDWDKTHAYFDKAWDAVLGNLEHRFRVGPVQWPGYFIRAGQESGPTP